MAADVVVKGEGLNPCCAEWKEKYSKLEGKRNSLREAVKILREQIDKFEAENLRLKKVYDEERSRADGDREAKAKEFLRVQVSLENEISVLKSEISSFQEKGQLGVKDADEKTAMLQSRVSEGEMEIDRLKKLLEKEKSRADSEKRKAAAEKNKAAEALKLVKIEKRRADEEKMRADAEGKKAEDYRRQLERFKREADEATSKLALEDANLVEAKNKLEAEKQKVILEKKRAESEKVKAEGQRKLAEVNMKKAMDQKSRAEDLSCRLEEAVKKIKKLQEERHELLSSVEVAGTERNSFLPEARKSGSDKVNLVSESQIENVAMLGDNADEEMEEESGHEKLISFYKKQIMEDKYPVDNLFRQLEVDKRTIKKLQEQLHALERSRSIKKPASDITTNDESERKKFLEKQLKFEKMRVKHAKQVAKLEKRRGDSLHREVSCLKKELHQFSQRLDILDIYFSRSPEGIDDLDKVGSFTNVERTEFPRDLLNLKQSLVCPGIDNQIIKQNCIDTHVSDCFKQITECNSSLLPVSVRTVTGIDSISEPLIGGSDRKLLESSAINSSTASFSDRQLVGSQGRGEFSAAASTKFREENSNQEAVISKLPGKLIRNNFDEKDAIVAENSVRSPLHKSVVARASGLSRKRILDAVESVESFYLEGKKLLLQIEENLLANHDNANKKMEKSLEERRHDKHVRSRKKKSLHIQDAVMQLSCNMDEKKKRENFETIGSKEAVLGRQVPLFVDAPTTNAHFCKDQGNALVKNNQDTAVGFAAVVDGNYMKLLDLDDAIDEERYKMAVEMPVSPTLPDIGFQSCDALDIGGPSFLVGGKFCEVNSDGKDLSPSNCLEVVDDTIHSNNFKPHTENSENPKLQEAKDCSDCSANLENRIDLSNSARAGDDDACRNWSSDLEVRIANMSLAIRDEAKLLRGSDFEADGILPLYVVVFSNSMDENSIARIICATRACAARCSLASRVNWAGREILLGLILEDDLLPKGKVCVFFSLLLHQISRAAFEVSGNFLMGESNLCLSSFTAHICSLLSDAEMRAIFADLCNLDDLFCLIDDFFVNKKVLACRDASSGQQCETVNISLDDINAVLLVENASNDQIVAGSIIFASVCTGLCEFSVMCETSYNIFRNHTFDSSLMITILHIFAHVGGGKYLNQSSNNLTMTVLKAMVMCLERENSFGAACLPCQGECTLEFPRCAKCPFAEGAKPLNTVTSLLLEKLRSCAIPGTSLMLNNPSQGINGESSVHEDVLFNLNTNCGTSCCLNSYGISQIQSKLVSLTTLCHFSDILSLVELIACKMGWALTSDKVVPQLLALLKLCTQETFSAAIITLLGEIGRLGVDASGYEDVGVQNLRSSLSTFLTCYTTNKSCLPLQTATVSALLGLLPFDIEGLIQGNAKLQVGTSEAVHAELISNWFFSLSSENQSLTMSLLQSTAVHKNQGRQFL